MHARVGVCYEYHDVLSIHVSVKELVLPHNAGSLNCPPIVLQIPETKVDTSQSLTPRDFSPSSATRRKRKNGRGKVRKSDPLWTGKVEREGVYGPGIEDPVWMTKAEAFPHPSTTLTTHTPSHLTPDWFQQPVKLLNSIEQALKHPSSEYPSMTSSHMTAPSSHMTNAGDHVTADFVTPKPPPKRRRTSSTSGPPLDDLGKGRYY